ncbi:MAG: hypothetical protein ACR2H2_01260 [Solirubrobacteraceae bacterium]
MRPPDERRVSVYLAALAERERSGLLEVRWRHGDGMHRRLYRVRDELPMAAAAIVRLGARTDVYVGCAPRVGRAGGLDAIKHTWVLWVDCDTPAAVAALQRFAPAPAIVVRSGVIRSGRARLRCRWAVRCRRHVFGRADATRGVSGGVDAR